MILKRAGSVPGKVLVTFQLPKGLVADSAHVVGDFNNWDRRLHRLTRSEDDVWQLTLELEHGKTYQFRYLINGATWQNDWHADRYVPNPFGGENSVLET